MQSLRPFLVLLFAVIVPNLSVADEIDLVRKAHPQEKPDLLVAIANCQFVPTDWADGDSFRIRTPEGHEVTIRLYAIDCVELHLTDATDARRLRAQRRYFGLARENIQESLDLAAQFAEQAAQTTAELLASPFTIHTSFGDGRGDGKFSRIYAFVETSDGRDLGEELVRRGLARAFGVARRTPTGEAREEYSARLADVELHAAKTGTGIWAATDWSSIVDVRKLQREEEAEFRLSLGDAPPPDEPIDLNHAARDELMRVPGIGEATANRIIEARAYKTVDDLVDTPGIGRATQQKLRPFFVVTE